MADGTFPSIISKDNDANSLSNPILVRLSDGSSAIGVTSNALDVQIKNTSIAVTASDLDIRNLDFSSDSILLYSNTAKDGSGIDYVPIVDSDGHLQVDIQQMPSITVDNLYSDDTAFNYGVSGADKVGAIGLLANDTLPDSVNEGDIGIPRMTLDRKQLMVIADPSNDARRLEITSNGEAEVRLTSHGLTSSSPLPISKDGNANSDSNPIYVKFAKTTQANSEVHDFDSATVSTGDSDDHDYAVVNSVFFLKSVIVSASGNCKFEVKVGPLAGLVTKAVGFLTGREGDTKQITFDPPIEVPVASSGTVRVTVTNRQGQSQDLYSTIIGEDII